VTRGISSESVEWGAFRWLHFTCLINALPVDVKFAAILVPMFEKFPNVALSDV